MSLCSFVQILAGPPDIRAHPGIGAARDKSPDPPVSQLGRFCGGHWRRIPIAFIAPRTEIGQLALVPQPAVADRGWCPIPISACRFAQITVGKHWASVRATPPTALA